LERIEPRLQLCDSLVLFLHDRLGLSFTAVALTYLTACPLGGVLFGAAMPIRRWVLGSILLGVLAVFPLYVGALALLKPPDIRFFPEAVLGGVFLSLLIGGSQGFLDWRERNPRRKRKKR
jgi:hypothetical protein